jgi:predicted dehydrogenase
MKAGLRGVVVGLGHMGRHHLRRLAERPEIALEVVDPARGLPAISGFRPDFAVIATPTSVHLETALPFLEAGVPCLVEKPIAADSAAAAKLAAFPHCMPGHIERFNPAFRVLPLGTARFVQAERIAPLSGRSVDVDVVRDLMIHDLDLALLLLFGEVREVRAIGVAAHISGVPAQSTFVFASEESASMLPDIANARIETDVGSVANLTASRVSRKAARVLRVFTCDDYWSVDLGNHRVERVPWGSGDLRATEVALSDDDALVSEHDAFLAAVRQQDAFPVPSAHGLRAVALTERVLEAMILTGRLAPEDGARVQPD